MELENTETVFQNLAGDREVRGPEGGTTTQYEDFFRDLADVLLYKILNSHILSRSVYVDEQNKYHVPAVTSVPNVSQTDVSAAAPPPHSNQM